jgi:hypothetical protein
MQLRVIFDIIFTYRDLNNYILSTGEKEECRKKYF